MNRKTLAVAALFATLAPAVSAEPWLTSVRDRYPSVSPDGTLVLFESDRSGKSGLYILDLASKTVRPLLVDEGAPSSGSWCPDGKQIVFNDKVGEDFDVFIVNADGSARRNLTNSPTEESHPHCGIDGRIYFNSDRATPDRSLPWAQRNHDLYSAAADGTGVIRLTDCKAVCTNPNPSRDGTRVAFRLGVRSPGLSWAQRAAGLNSEIGILDLKTGKILNITNHPAYDTWPSWSPDGKWVVYGSNRDKGPNVGQLFMTAADGAETRRLTSGPASFGEPSFAPDGATVYFSKSLLGSDSRASFIGSIPLGGK